jgi:hypothetical protein
MTFAERGAVHFWCCLALAVWLSACSSLPQGLMQSQPAGLSPLTQDMGGGVGTLGFQFEFDDKADAVDGEVGSGYIVVSRDGKEIQALPHAFELAHDKLNPEAWLEFRDFNGDGLQDFRVTRLYAQEGALSVDSLYQFDAKTGTCAQVDVVSNAGEIASVAPGCVSLKVLSAAGAVKQEGHCFSAASGRWVLGKPGTAPKKAVAASAAAVCDPQRPSLLDCRKARIEQDRTLLAAVREFRLNKRQELQAERGKGYANAFAQTLDLDHQSWRRYRDARCAAQSREQGVPVKELPAVTELCRYDWSRDQLRRYKDQIARLSSGKGSP